MCPCRKSRFTIDIPIIHGGTELSAIYNTLSGAFLLCSREDWTALLRADGAGCDPATVEHLRGQGILVASGTDETVVYENWKLQHVYSANTIKVQDDRNAPVQHALQILSDRQGIA